MGEIVSVDLAVLAPDVALRAGSAIDLAVADGVALRAGSAIDLSLVERVSKPTGIAPVGENFQTLQGAGAGYANGRRFWFDTDVPALDGVVWYIRTSDLGPPDLPPWGHDPTDDWKTRKVILGGAPRTSHSALVYSAIESYPGPMKRYQWWVGITSAETGIRGWTFAGIFYQTPVQEQGQGDPG